MPKKDTKAGLIQSVLRQLESQALEQHSTIDMLGETLGASPTLADKIGRSRLALMRRSRDELKAIDKYLRTQNPPTPGRRPAKAVPADDLALWCAVEDLRDEGLSERAATETAARDANVTLAREMDAFRKRYRDINIRFGDRLRVMRAPRLAERILRNFADLLAEKHPDGCSLVTAAEVMLTNPAISDIYKQALSDETFAMLIGACREQIKRP